MVQASVLAGEARLEPAKYWDESHLMYWRSYGCCLAASTAFGVLTFLSISRIISRSIWFLFSKIALPTGR